MVFDTSYRISILIKGLIVHSLSCYYAMHKLAIANAQTSFTSQDFGVPFLRLVPEFAHEVYTKLGGKEPNIVHLQT